MIRPEETPPPQAPPEVHLRLSPWLALACRIAARLTTGSLILEFPDGRRRVFPGARPGPEAHLRLVRERAIRRLLAGGALGFGEAYLAGDWESRDLRQLLQLLARNCDALGSAYDGGPLARALARLRHLLRANTRRGSRRNVLSHYDLGDAFYAAWLDPSMTYSSARFGATEQDLGAAQAAKLGSIARLIGLRPEHHVLEVGCGFGSFAEFAAREVGARVTAITNSVRHHASAAARIQAAGLAGRVEVRLQDYRDVAGRFDRIASIEMLEAVGERYWPAFFGKLRTCLAADGVAGLQVITIADEHFERYRRHVDFIQRHVFPGGMLPSPGALQHEVRRAGLGMTQAAAFGLDYARTLQAWQARFQAAWPGLARHGFDVRFKRLWEYYLAYCEAGFRVGFIDVRQLALRLS